MPAVKYIKKKIEQSYLVWFQNSNLYTQLEEPAWFVFSKAVKGYKTETIAQECSNRYELPYVECLQFVKDIRQNITQMNKPLSPAKDNNDSPVTIINHNFNVFSKHRYLLNEKLIQFSVENQKFESFIHPLISYLETDKTAEKVSVFELFEFQEKIAFRLNGEIKGFWEFNESHKLVGFIFMCIINEIYQKTDDFWLMTVHAAALTNGRKTILIPAKSGSGKTTISALLQNKGYKLLSDDFVPIDKHSYSAWPFPIAMSIKMGALDVLSPVYPGLKGKPLKVTTAQKIVKYLSPNKGSSASELIFPIKDVITVKYDPSVEFEFKKASRLESIKLLLDQSWILPNPGNAGRFLDQAAQWSFYELTYSNNEKALDAISQLFENE